MKMCPKCQEENSDMMDKCYKCGNPLAPSRTKKLCEYCDEVFTTTSSTCPNCGSSLKNYNTIVGSNSSYPSSTTARDVEVWEIILTVLIPIVGLVLGFIHLGKSDQEGGKKLLIISTVLVFVSLLLSQIFPSLFLFGLLS